MSIYPGFGDYGAYWKWIEEWNDEIAEEEKNRLNDEIAYDETQHLLDNELHITIEPEIEEDPVFLPQRPGMFIKPSSNTAENDLKTYREKVRKWRKQSIKYLTRNVPNEEEYYLRNYSPQHPCDNTFAKVCDVFGYVMHNFTSVYCSGCCYGDPPEPTSRTYMTYKHYTATVKNQKVYDKNIAWISTNFLWLLIYFTNDLPNSFQSPFVNEAITWGAIGGAGSTNLTALINYIYLSVSDVKSKVCKELTEDYNSLAFYLYLKYKKHPDEAIKICKAMRPNIMKARDSMMRFLYSKEEAEGVFAMWSLTVTQICAQEKKEIPIKPTEIPKPTNTGEIRIIEEPLDKKNQ